MILIFTVHGWHVFVRGNSLLFDQVVGAASNILQGSGV